MAGSDAAAEGRSATSPPPPSFSLRSPSRMRWAFSWICSTRRVSAAARALILSLASLAVSSCFRPCSICWCASCSAAGAEELGLVQLGASARCLRRGEDRCSRRCARTPYLTTVTSMENDATFTVEEDPIVRGGFKLRVTDLPGHRVADKLDVHVANARSAVFVLDAVDFASRRRCGRLRRARYDQRQAWRSHSINKFMQQVEKIAISVDS